MNDYICIPKLLLNVLVLPYFAVSGWLIGVGIVKLYTWLKQWKVTRVRH